MIDSHCNNEADAKQFLFHEQQLPALKSLIKLPARFHSVQLFVLNLIMSDLATFVLNIYQNLRTNPDK